MGETVLEHKLPCRKGRHRACGGCGCSCPCHGPQHDPQARPTWADFLSSIVGDCIDHPHEQVGRCVYCKACGRRLYQGTRWSEEERATLREVMGRTAPEPAP